MDDEARRLLRQAAERKLAAGTPEQRKHRAEVDARNLRIQHGVRQPKSGVFGKASK